MLEYPPTPTLDISNHPLLRGSGVRVIMKREDLNHQLVSGNKWWKLKYNIEEAINTNHNTVLTFGGAFSNHIYATAAAAKAAGLRCIGIIRGEETLPLNPTLLFAVNQGMLLQYVDRQTYRTKDSPVFIQTLERMWGRFYRIPEGGTNELAVKGCEEFGKVLDDIPADYICLAVGTGGTMAGVIRGVSPSKKVIGLSVLKDGGFLKDQINAYLNSSHTVHWELLTQYSYGGYGKRDKTVADVINSFSEYMNIDLDFVYTGKMMCGVIDMVTRGYFPKGRTILAVHTGGLQGQS